MTKENFSVTKLNDSRYKNEIRGIDDEIIYCEVEYRRDRSSFAGIGLKIINAEGTIVIRQCEERIVQNISKYEKIYIGCEPDYIDSIKEIFSLEKRNYGIEVIFLIYSDVRSSQIIFEKLIRNIDSNIDTIRKQFK